MSARGMRGCGTGILAFLLVLGLAIGAVVLALRWTEDHSASGRCVAETGDLRASLDADQADNAALLAGVSLDRDLPARAATIAIATALQESKMRNIDYGDRDSVGLFQQRPSQGWGTVEQIMDPVYSTNAFYDVLITVRDYEALQITDAAQRVQRSAFPDAYAQHETRARAFASALTGHSSAALTCHLDPLGDDEDANGASTAEGGAGLSRAGLAQALDARLERDLGLGAEVVSGGVLRVDATALTGGAGEEPDRLGWAVAQWAVATASTTGVSTVVADGQAWVRAGDESTWQAVGSAAVPDIVRSTAAELPAGSVLIGVRSGE